MSIRRGSARRAFVPAGGGGSSSSVPTDIPNCVLWLQADRGVTQAGTVSAWADQSGAGNNYAEVTAGERPAYSANSWTGGKPNITYTGAEILEGTSAVLGTTALTIGIRTKYTQSSSEVVIFGMQYVGFHYTVSQLNGKIKFLGPSGGSTLSAATYNDGTPKSIIAAWDAGVAGGRLDLYIDGVLEGTLGTDTGTASANGDRNTIAGLSSDSFADVPQFAGDIPLIVFYSRKLSAGEITTLNTILAGY